MLKEPVPVNVFEVGQQLHTVKQELIKRRAEAVGGLSVVDERKVASAFYKFVQVNMGFSQATTAQYVRVYERFACSKHRSKVEELFTAGELAMLASLSDDELDDVVSGKEANPNMTRMQLKQFLEAWKAA